MYCTAKNTAQPVADALVSYGVRDVVTSPGSRNAPLVVAVCRNPQLKVQTVVDERSAAFIALGIASVSRRPVAIICTSGTALLNYAPAVAEAFYRKVPLIVISADRPQEWIGQDDSQTLPQPGAFGKLVKMSVCLPCKLSDDKDIWLCVRLLNETLQASLEGRQGPVHINVPLGEPLETDIDPTDFGSFPKVELLLPDPRISAAQAKEIASRLAGRKLLIVGGFAAPSASLNRAMNTLATLPGVVVVADALANLNGPDFICRPDLIDYSKLLKSAGGAENSTSKASAPDVLITFGGSLISKHLKQYLRTENISEHWHVGANESLIDSYFHLTHRVEIEAENFFPRLANSLSYLAKSQKSGGFATADLQELKKYTDTWRNAANADISAGSEEIWDARRAIDIVTNHCPERWNLQLSNGLSVRYALNTSACRFHRRDCNRGVSGIDGSVSTALGASLAYPDVTLLITGDMSMQYDLQALSSNLLTPRFKIVVINNSGGGIFRRISTTRSLPELENRFACHLNLPLAELAPAYGLKFFQADSLRALQDILPEFIRASESPALLEISIPIKSVSEI